MVTPTGPEQPTRPNREQPDAPTSRLRVISGRVRGALADTRPLQTPAYRRLWLAGVVTVIGAQLSVVAVPTQIYELTGSSAYVGLTGLFGLVPLVVFGLWGGAIADAVDRRLLLLVSGGAIAASSLALWVTAASGVGGVWLVLVLFAVQTSFLAINQPTRSAVIPRLIPADQLPAANALNMTVAQVGAIAGPLLAGVLIPVVGLPTLYLLDAIFLLATLWATWRLPTMPPEPSASRKAGLREIRDGFRYAAMHKVLLVSFLIDVVAMGFGCRGCCSRRCRTPCSATPRAVAPRWACCSPRSRSAWSPRGCCRAGWPGCADSQPPHRHRCRTDLPTVRRCRARRPAIRHKSCLPRTPSRSRNRNGDRKALRSPCDSVGRDTAAVCRHCARVRRSAPDTRDRRPANPDDPLRSRPGHPTASRPPAIS